MCLDEFLPYEAVFDVLRPVEYLARGNAVIVR